MEETYETMYATCTTAGCGNKGQPIQVSIPVPPTPESVTCGVCSNQVTDLTGTRPLVDTRIPAWLM